MLTKMQNLQEQNLKSQKSKISFNYKLYMKKQHTETFLHIMSKNFV